jgi:hypothetical protein
VWVSYHRVSLDAPRGGSIQKAPLAGTEHPGSLSWVLGQKPSLLYGSAGWRLAYGLWPDITQLQAYTSMHSDTGLASPTQKRPRSQMVTSIPFGKTTSLDLETGQLQSLHVEKCGLVFSSLKYIGVDAEHCRACHAVLCCAV